MKTKLLVLMLGGHLSYAHAKEDLATALDTTPSPKSHSIDFIDKNLKLTLACTVGHTQPILNVTMTESFALSGDPSVLIISSDKQNRLKLRGTATLMNFTSGDKTAPDLWESLSQLQSTELHLEVISFRSSKYTSSNLVAAGFTDAVVKLKQDCVQ
ncbi:hypothetical protein [Shewanella sp. CG12_big_fil_rev_8_21_14_0_65_47_15]|uniref:hypothetical protein n=1 Tax=Shewanella sp. CG12_big_fil_rev_8_21_14_0_65_47_15 TaxID=1975537 RepID=UPI000CC3D979|nr:hypothetical protein [Shewanella sp. CG12_big_fil_rev_8_21_14_0_65_47_15]PIW58780.1 MAG: hypothetical protein COW15_20745 [Shewanella sp. CG12_big_fil_rev_8_21_14_0_65_47_15]